MHVILLSGGSGKRLWPLSNDARSKQFLKLFRNDAGEHESMVQRVWGQLSQAGLGHQAYIATGRAQVEVIQSQLGEEPAIIVEPERRDTFPAIALSAACLYAVHGVPLDAVVAVLPVDPFVGDHFFAKVMELEEALLSSNADIGLLGVSPAYPSAKYGYIVPIADTPVDAIGGKNNDPSLPYRLVSHFEEKPDEERALQLMEQQALWNCGVFAFRLGYMVQELEARGLPTDYDRLLEQYQQLRKISFDYEVVEKAERVIVLPYAGDWKDLGTWNTLTEEMSSSLIGHAIKCDESLNTHVVNELDLPVIVLGVSNAVIAVSPDGILVADKAASPRIKEVMQHREYRPMYEERRWGRYRVLDYTKHPECGEVLTKRIRISAGRNLSYQYHTQRREVWTVIAGQGEMVLDGSLHTIAAGDVVIVPPLMKHSIRATAELEIIEVQTGTELTEEDIVRLALDWETIVREHVADGLNEMKAMAAVEVPR
ncbi:Mannose-1-phosphate guanylyltransferase [Paenibacillus curdlanolyticus YK9]|uniref:Mannose-1-phosphate guanylyltransferase n=1 Tax=Paenibacillus curdlanolyticus YK9 TaxID=717606 RepID=E0IEQ9_9BACL|nr:sugar phosphate nucleotidyltransferase [Paenibacillus curdlanolyticus]EFM09147.1 Mannose-1-phosphate guanylyltransferase [Paenibacillus curdlanolyticus YK9]